MFWAFGKKFQGKHVYQLLETGSDRGPYFLLGRIKLRIQIYCALDSDPAAMATIENDYYRYHLSWNHLRLTWTWQKSALGFETDPKCWEIIWKKDDGVGKVSCLMIISWIKTEWSCWMKIYIILFQENLDLNTIHLFNITILCKISCNLMNLLQFILIYFHKVLVYSYELYEYM